MVAHRVEHTRSVNGSFGVRTHISCGLADLAPAEDGEIFWAVNEANRHVAQIPAADILESQWIDFWPGKAKAKPAEVFDQVQASNRPCRAKGAYYAESVVDVM